ncbi:MAG: hypothetical protein HC814_07660 [Rhodobacteraceae bacterium]|nr:hypothetical protein [Paracoccaceae bacterium]
MKPTLHPALIPLSFLAATALAAAPADADRKPMKFMDILQMRSASSPDVSPDGKWMLYTLSVPDWKAAKSYTDIFLVSTVRGLESTRQMTFTKDKNETSPRWSRDGKFFVFLSNRDGSTAPGSSSATPASQLYLMRPDGGEARRITEVKDGISSVSFSRDGKWLAFAAGKDEARQIWAFNVATLETEAAKPLTRHATPVGSWQFSPDSRRIYFVAPDELDKTNKERKEKKFDVRIRNEPSPLAHLWAIDLATKKETRLTSGTNYSVGSVTVSKDSRWIGFKGTPDNRYFRTVNDAPAYADLYLLDVAGGRIERLTENADISVEQHLLLAGQPAARLFRLDDFHFFRNTRVYLRDVSDQGGKLKKLGADFDGDASIDSGRRTAGRSISTRDCGQRPSFAPWTPPPARSGR